MPGKAQNQNGKFLTPLLPLKELLKSVVFLGRCLRKRSTAIVTHSPELLPQGSSLWQGLLFSSCVVYIGRLFLIESMMGGSVFGSSLICPAKHSILPVVVSQQRITEWRHTRTTRQIEGLLLMILSRKRLQLFGAQDPSHLSYGGTNLATSGMTLYGFMSLLCRFMSREWLEVPKR